ncbi:hypothetical protein E2C01_011021 [Portunus trituberculatus]|uniref:Uncharacterized protein n=1 Tax=Portunus trituberculatus TaxID=210409 RepID=A0A5B7DAF5_PORTR|nr:hypothetical protein [Portunus trituberculatus]
MPLQCTHLTEPCITIQGMWRQCKTSHITLVFILCQAKALCSDMLNECHSTALGRRHTNLTFAHEPTIKTPNQDLYVDELMDKNKLDMHHQSPAQMRKEWSGLGI